MKWKNKTRMMTLIALMTAVISVCSLISIPTPWGIPFTLQTFAVALCGFVLGMKFAPLAVVLYLALGAVGIPVFSGFSSGFAQLAGYTGGFLWGFILLATACGAGKRFQNKLFLIMFALCGLLACHLLGSLQFGLITGRSFVQSFLIASLPYLLKDAISMVLAYAIAVPINFALRKTISIR